MTILVAANRDLALRGEVVIVTKARLLEMQQQAIANEGVTADPVYHWHWAAVVNELLWLRAHSSLNFADAVPQKGVEE